MCEFALSIKGLERFVKKEPLRRVHESAFGVLALESEEVDRDYNFSRSNNHIENQYINIY